MNSIQINTATAFAPSHITGFFRIFPDGSTGAGLNTTEGVRTKVTSFSDNRALVRVFINGAYSDSAQVSQKVIAAYSEYLKDNSYEIQHSILSPIGYGLGMSGAGALSLSIALNKVLGRPYDEIRCMEIAKFAEIESGTGLGDVVAQQFPGVMMGLPPYPSKTIINIEHDNEKVICAFFEPIDTAKVIRNEAWKDKINQVGGECMEELNKELSIKNFMKLSRYFTYETGLASESLKIVLNEIEDASMAMLGQTAFILTSDINDVVLRLSKFTDRISVASISSIGASLIE